MAKAAAGLPVKLRESLPFFAGAAGATLVFLPVLNPRPHHRSNKFFAHSKPLRHLLYGKVLSAEETLSPVLSILLYPAYCDLFREIAGVANPLAYALPRHAKALSDLRHWLQFYHPHAPCSFPAEKVCLCDPTFHGSPVATAAGSASVWINCRSMSADMWIESGYAAWPSPAL